MPSKPTKKTTVRLGVKGARYMYRHPRARRATVRAVRPAAKVGWRVGKVVAKRKARQRVAVATAEWAVRLETAGAQLQRLGEGSQLLSQMVMVYGPMAAEVLGLIEPPKPSRTALKVTTGIVIGGGAVYFLEPEHGPERRQQLLELMKKSR